MKNLRLATLVLVAFVGAALGQNTAAVKGKASDQNGQPIADAQVQMVNPETGQKYTLKTNKKGEYFSIGINPGMYSMKLVKEGKELFSFNQVPVSLGKENEIDFDLKKEMQQFQQGGTPADPSAQGKGQTSGAPARDPNAPIVLTDEQKKKLTPEQLKQYEEYQKVVNYNASIKGVNAALTQAKAASEAGNTDQAVQLVTSVTQQSPALPLPWAILGQYQLDAAKKSTDSAARLERYAAAAAAFQKGIQTLEAIPSDQPDARLKADLPKWRVGYGSALVGSRKYDDAIKVFDQAAQESAADAKFGALANYNAGIAATNAGKSDVAVAYYDKAIAADPTLADAYYQKGVALLGKATVDKSGKMVAPSGTEEAFDKYLELAPNGPNAEAAKQMLETIAAKISTGFKKK